MTVKQKIKQQHLVLLQDKIDLYQDMISGLSNDAQNDAKGSAGDKHETALSMMHLEQEKLTNKLKETIALKKILESKSKLSLVSTKVPSKSKITPLIFVKSIMSP